MLWSNYHICCTKESITACCIDCKLFSIMTVDFKINFSTEWLTDPVALHSLYAVRPVKGIKVFKKAFCIFSDFQNPLADCLVCNNCTTAFAFSFLNFFVGKTCKTAWTPVDWSFCFVCKSLFIELEENPLSPLVVIWFTCRNAAVPVVGKTEGLDLACEVFDVCVSCDWRMCTSLDGVVFCRKTESIVSHWMKNIEAVHSKVAAVNVCSSVSFRMTYMKTGTARIRKHIQHIAAFFFRKGFIFRYAESLVFVPIFLPLRLNILKRISHNTPRKKNRP